jgi:AcrR family transcriptional regulator
LDQDKLQAPSPFNRRFQHQQKRAAILSEAARLFNIHGARATRLGDVAQRLDLNKTSLYYYVKSKDDLVCQVYLASCDAIEAMLEQAGTGGNSGAEKLAVFIRAYFQAWQAIVRGERPHIAILTEIRALKPAQRQQVARRYTALFDRVQALLRVGAADGSLYDCDPLGTALALFGLVQLTILWLPDFDAEQFGLAADDFIDILFAGIAAPGRRARLAIDAGAPDRRQGTGQGRGPAGKQEAFCKVGSAWFNRKGFKGASLDEIADEVGVSKGSFYHHVRDKDDLLHQCFLRSLAIIADTQACAEDGSGKGLDKVIFCVVRLFRLQNSDAGPLIRFNLIPSLSRSYREQVLAGIAQVSDRFGRMIEQGVADGSIRPVNAYIAQQMLLSAIDLSAELRWMRPMTDIDSACEDYFAFYFCGIARQGGRTDVK